MRILAADFGDARTGLAVCDSGETLASPIGNAAEKSLSKMAEKTAAVARERGAQLVVVGLPINMDGSEGPRAAKCRRFASELEALLGGVPVALWDERSTTVLDCDVHGKQRRARIDAEAACIILDSYLAYRRNCRARGEQL